MDTVLFLNCIKNQVETYHYLLVEIYFSIFWGFKNHLEIPKMNGTFENSVGNS